MLIVDKHCSDVCCDDFLVPQIDRKSKEVKKNSDMKNFICNQYGENSLFQTLKVSIFVDKITKAEAIQMQFVCIFFHMY